jgi:hypothetical protein
VFVLGYIDAFLWCVGRHIRARVDEPGPESTVEANSGPRHFLVQNFESLFLGNKSPSSVKSSDIQSKQLDDTYYSPCSNAFALVAHRLAFQPLPEIQSPRFVDQINMTYEDLEAVMTATDRIGYCSQVNTKEGVTALFTADLSKCFFEYSRC